MATRIGDLIVARGLASVELVEAAHRESRARGEPLCSRLLARGVEEGELASVLSEKHGVPGVDLSHSAVGLDLLELVPRAVAEGDLILPLSLDGGRIHLAMARPWDDRVVAEVRFVTGKEVSPYVAVQGALLRAVAEAYEERGHGAAVWRGRACAFAAPHLEAVLAGVEPVEGADPIPDAEIVIEVEPEVAPAAARKAPLVLVVDDEPEIRHLVQRLLVSKGYEVAIAVDGQEALDLADQLVPDLVLLDAMLPKVHGFDACRRIKASARTRAVPVIMMTAIYRGWRFAQDARDSYGAIDYVEKPFRMEDLLQRIERALREGGPEADPAPAAADGDTQATLVARGKDLLAAQKVGEAVQVLSDAVAMEPRTADAQFQLGRALHAAGDAFGAMTALERAAEASPGHLPSLRALAGLYEESGFRRKAAEVLERALPSVADGEARSALRKDVLRLIA